MDSGGKKNRIIWRPQPKVHPPHANLLIGGTIQSTVHIERAGVPRCAFNAFWDEKGDLGSRPVEWGLIPVQGSDLTWQQENTRNIRKEHQKSCRPCVRAYTQSQSIFEKMTLNGIGLAFRVLAEKFQLARFSSTQ